MPTGSPGLLLNLEALIRIIHVYRAEQLTQPCIVGPWEQHLSLKQTLNEASERTGIKIGARSCLRRLLNVSRIFPAARAFSK